MWKLEKWERRAAISWNANDVKTLRPKWSLKKCDAELERVEKYLQDRLIEFGWDVLDTLLETKKVSKRLPKK